MTIPIARLDPRKTGLRRWLGPLEAEIMMLFWERGTLTGHELQTPLVKRWKPLAYTTVNTMLKKLHDRGLIERIGRESNGYVYRAICTRREYERAQTRAALAALEEQATL